MPKDYSRAIEETVNEHQHVYEVDPKTGDLVRVGEQLARTFVTTKSVDQRAFYGTVTPGYRSLRDGQGFLPTTYCIDQGLKRAARLKVQSYDIEYGGKKYPWRFRTMASLSSYSSVQAYHLDQDVLAEVQSKLRRKVLDQDFNAPVFLAEAGKTAQLVAKRATDVALAIRALKKGDVAQFLNRIQLTSGRRRTRREMNRLAEQFAKKDIHNVWLEYKYGWMPLLQDVHGAAKNLAEMSFKRDIVTHRATASKTRQEIRDTPNALFEGLRTYTAKAWVTVKVRNRSAAVANSTGSLNPLLIAWELVPFSFVADWFANIGDCLSEMTAFAGVEILTGGFSNKVHERGTSKTPYYGWENPNVEDSESYYYIRYPGVATMPSLRIKSNPLDLTKVISSVALLRQQVARR